MVSRPSPLGSSLPHPKVKMSLKNQLLANAFDADTAFEEIPIMYLNNDPEGRGDLNEGYNIGFLARRQRLSPRPPEI
jgi:hypothetical protein